MLDGLLERTEGGKLNVTFAKLVSAMVAKTSSLTLYLDQFDNPNDPGCPGKSHACYQASFETMFRIMKDTLYQPHMVDLNLLFESNFTDDISQIEDPPWGLTDNITVYPVIDFETASDRTRNSTLLNLAPFIPFCKLANLWSDPPAWGSNRYLLDGGHPFSQFCTLFRPSLTDNGICYTFNGVPARHLLKPSKFLDAYETVFGLPDQAYPKEAFVSHGIGVKNGLEFILDAHTLTNLYKYLPNKDNNFLISLQNPLSFPLPLVQGITIPAGFITK